MNGTRPGACEVCSAFWVTHVGHFDTLGMSQELMAEVWRCRACGAFCEVGDFGRPRVITREQARRAHPDLDARP
ncbi:hypothetical protein RZO50_03580 [Microbacterium sp. SSW1-59]|uniref:hypothetical protein n=1 Tax=Microbacterium xanthum TaxID=3079794 RepID=UPI002AD26046|nr:hypothetical protein [Microbacterium sp. SSW1-59]MDZ8200578.1 hypothetical protein [Microbacterium sp. SSW1-59]